jgi:enterochelin esterase-like enzyme
VSSRAFQQTDDTAPKGAVCLSVNDETPAVHMTSRSANDLFDLLHRMRAPEAARIPYLYLACGDQDSLLESNRALDQLLARLKIPHEYHELSGGHDLAIYHDLIPRAIELAARRMTAGRSFG